MQSGGGGTETLGGSAPARAAAAAAAGAAKKAADKKVFDEQIQLVDSLGMPLFDTAYKIVSSSGASWEGVTDGDGKTQRVVTDAAETLNIYLKG